MKSLLCILVAAVALSGCATFGFRTAAPEPDVPHHIQEAFDYWLLPSKLRNKDVEVILDTGVFTRPFTGESVSDYDACQKHRTGICKIRLDEGVCLGWARVYRCEVWEGDIAVFIHTHRVQTTPRSLAVSLRTHFRNKGMQVLPVEYSPDDSRAVLQYSGERNGKSVRGKFTAFYHPDSEKEIFMIYGEWPVQSDMQMSGTFTRIESELERPTRCE